MRQLSRAINKDGEGSVKLEAQDAEDVWNIYNLIAVGDAVRASTFRKIQQETTTGSSSSERVHITLTIRVETIDFDASTTSIRVGGRVCEENGHVRVGAFHTIDIELHRALTVTKPHWDSVSLARLDESLNSEKELEVCVVLMEEGYTQVLLIGRSLTVTKAKISKNIPRKGKNAIYNRDGAMKAFFQQVYRAVVDQVDWDAVKHVIVASPGYTKDEFVKFLLLTAAQNDDRGVIENKSKLIVTHASSAYKHALDEIFSRPEIRARLAKSTKVMAELSLLNDFHAMIRQDDSKAIYGPAFVQHAADMCAIEHLLIADRLYRALDVGQRKKYVALTEQVKASGTKVTVFSTQHSSGEQLNLMGGVAAILRFPLPSLDDVEPSDQL